MPRCPSPPEGRRRRAAVHLTQKQKGQADRPPHPRSDPARPGCDDPARPKVETRERKASCDDAYLQPATWPGLLVRKVKVAKWTSSTVDFRRKSARRWSTWFAFLVPSAGGHFCHFRTLLVLRKNTRAGEEASNGRRRTVAVSAPRTLRLLRIAPHHLYSALCGFICWCVKSSLGASVAPLAPTGAGETAHVVATKTTPPSLTAAPVDSTVSWCLALRNAASQLGLHLVLGPLQRPSPLLFKMDRRRW